MIDSDSVIIFCSGGNEFLFVKLPQSGATGRYDGSRGEAEEKVKTSICYDLNYHHSKEAMGIEFQVGRRGG